MIYIAQGELEAARDWIAGRPPEIQAADLVLNFGLYWDLMSVRRCAAAALSGFAGRGVRRLRGGPGSLFRPDPRAHRRRTVLRRTSEEAERGFAPQLEKTPDDAQLHIIRGLALAYLGRRAEAIREGERGLALLPVSRDAFTGAYLQHQLVRIYMVLGERRMRSTCSSLCSRSPIMYHTAGLRSIPISPRSKAIPVSKSCCGAKARQTNQDSQKRFPKIGFKVQKAHLDLYPL